MPISNCPTGVSQYLSPLCGQPQPKDGGIAYIGVAVDDIDTTATNAITDVTNTTQWQNALDGGDVEIIGPVLGDKPAATINEQKVASCLPSVAASMTFTINIQDLNTDRDNTTFYNRLNQDLSGLKFFYIDCNNDFYGWIDDAVAKFSKVHDQDAESGNVRWEGTISWRQPVSTGELAPTDITTVVTTVDWS